MQTATPEPLKLIHHSILFDDNLAVGVLKDRNWPYFIEQLPEVTHPQEIEIDGLEGLGTLEEIGIINSSRENITIFKEVYSNLFNAVADCLRDYFNYIHSKKLEELEKDLMLQNAYKIVRTYYHFFMKFS